MCGAVVRSGCRCSDESQHCEACRVLHASLGTKKQHRRRQACLNGNSVDAGVPQASGLYLCHHHMQHNTSVPALPHALRHTTHRVVRMAIADGQLQVVALG